MKLTYFAITLTVVSALLASGCVDVPPVPKDAQGNTVKVFNVADESEQASSQRIVDAHANYRYRLLVLQAYYAKNGVIKKQDWTDQELKNLQQSYFLDFAGLVPAEPTDSPNIDESRETTLVEQVVAARRDYRAAIGVLSRLLAAEGQDFRALVIDRMNERLVPERTYLYFVESAELPPATLRPSEVIPEAEAMFQEASELYKRGKAIPGFPNRQKERRALLKFQSMIEQYPTSTRIAEAAYYIAEIYKEFLSPPENYRAVAWYKRAWQWDPNILKPARFQAAVIYDIRLSNYGEALKLYREVLEKETFNWTNTRYARDRIIQLTTKDQE